MEVKFKLYNSNKINFLFKILFDLSVFAKEQYFDSNGLFISVVFSAPIIVNCAIIVMMWLYESFSLVIQIVKFIKRAINKKNKNQEWDSQESKKTN